MKLNWKILERGIYLLSLIGVIITWRVDKARTVATTETTVVNMSEDIKEINEKLKRNEEYWLNQMGINSRIVTYIELDNK